MSRSMVCILPVLNQQILLSSCMALAASWLLLLLWASFGFLPRASYLH
jgi:hypothetical protein